MSRVDSELGDTGHLQRFTATGRPFNPNLGAGAPQGGGMSGGVGMSMQSMLPHRFTDSSVITVPVRRSDLKLDEVAGINLNPVVKEEKSSWFSRRKSKDDGDKKTQVYMLQMTRGDYLKYCAKDEQGNCIGSEPQEVARNVLRIMVAEQTAPGYVGPIERRNMQ